MSETDQNARPSVETCGSLPRRFVAPSQTRRSILAMALASGACATVLAPAVADDDQPGSDERPQKADLLVFSEGDRTGQVIQPHDLNLGGGAGVGWPDGTPHRR